MITRSYHSLQFDIVGGKSDSICYILFPLPPRDSELKWLETVPEKYGITAVLLSGIDWNKDMTPWPAKGLRKDEWFSGEADVFLKSLETDFIPYVENEVIGAAPSHRFLMGVSLSGLFSVWTAFKSGSFDGVASVSGSFWYDGFVDWARKNALNPAVRKIWLSLGDMEKLSRNRRLSQVQDCTEELEQILKTSCHETVFTLEHGTHFSPMTPRFANALAMLTS